MPPSQLAALRAGDRGRLVSIGGERPYRRRLMELGFLPGARVRVLRRVAVGGLLEVEVRGCRVTVRLSEAEELLVDPS